MTKIRIEDKKYNGLKVAVMNSRDILVGYAFIGPDGEGGYIIHRTESWRGPNCKVSIKKNVLRLLSCKRFNKLIAGPDFETV